VPLFTIQDILLQATLNGTTLALASICFLQYVLQVYRGMKARQVHLQLQENMFKLEDELHDTKSRHSMSCLENHILREFVSQTELQKALKLLLRRFVPNPACGFSAVIEVSEHLQRLVSTRGLNSRSIDNLRLSSELMEKVRISDVTLLEGNELHKSCLLKSLSKDDRGKVSRIYLLPIGEGHNFAGVFITTELYPSNAPHQEQVELAQRLMISVAGNLHQTRTLEQQTHQLRSTKEILELRSIMDQPFETPILMIEAFLRKLTEYVHAERVVLYMQPTEGILMPKSLVRCGQALSLGVQSRWYEHEDHLAEIAFGRPALQMFDETELKLFGVNSLIRTAMTAPLCQSIGEHGLLCFTSGSTVKFQDSHQDLVNWATDFLSDSIMKMLNQAAVERQALMDGLTELANRRAFDQAMITEIQTAAQNNTNCSLVLFDLDHFKRINDNYGHQAGDEVLRVTARILRSKIQMANKSQKALIARYGGEELAVLLPGVCAQEAQRIAENIRNGVQSESLLFQGQVLRFTISAGLASFPEHADNRENLIGAADAALYQAKQSGRNRVGLAVPAMVEA